MVIVEKVIALAVLFGVFFSFGVLPLILKCSSHFRNVASKIPAGWSYMNCFSGGIFLATCMLHLVPDSLGDMEYILDKNVILKTKYPLGGLFISIGLFFVFFLEFGIEISFKRVKKKSSDKNADDKKVCEKTALQSQKEVKKYVSDNEIEHLLEGNDDEIDQENALNKLKEKSCDDSKEEKTMKRKNEHKTDDSESKKPEARFGVIISAISFHMLFEGLAVGLQTTTAAVWALLIPMGLHKCMIAISVGTLIMENTRSSKTFIILIALSSLITPLGVAVGITISEYQQSVSTLQYFVSSILRCIAAGTFLYVTFFEILQKELGSNLNWYKLFCVIFGYAMIALLRLTN